MEENETVKIKTDYISSHPVNVNNDCKNLLNNVLLDVIKHNFRIKINYN